MANPLFNALNKQNQMPANMSTPMNSNGQNPLFNALNGQAQADKETMRQIKQMFKIFRQATTGDPRQMTLELINSGKVPQQILNLAQQKLQSLGYLMTD